MTDSNYDVYYIYDALCGWCYGFSDIITTFKQKHQGQYNFKVLSGGLVTGERVGPIGVVAGYIKEAHKQVEERTGAKFGDAFLTGVLEPGEEIFDSVPAAMAMGLFRNQVPDKQVEFAARIQKAIYSEGLPPTEWTTFGKCAADFGLKPDEFAEKMQHPKLKELAQEEFKVVQHWGVRGFPAVVLHTGSRAFLLSNGYTGLKELDTALLGALNQKDSE